MAVKKYRAKSIQEAVGRVKKELGPDAMIVSTRRLPRSVRNPYGPDMFEIAALSRSALGDVDAEKIGGIADQLANPLLSEDLLAPSSGEGRRWEAIQSELVGIREMLSLIHQPGSLADMLTIHPGFLNLYARLVRAGISERRVQSIMMKCSALANQETAGEGDIVKRVIQEILSSIPVSNPFESEAGNVHFAAFVGPTGVGKTTTIAKLAADLSLKRKKEVGLISIDNYRIGAVEQLKTYAAIMGLPCLPAFTREDLRLAVNKMSNKDVILIDTAGHSHLDSRRMQELSRILEGDSSISTHLVVSAATKRLDMKEIADNFAVLNPQTYVFTKLDETRRRGAIIDHVLDAKMPISFVTDGQKVPQDIRAASEKELLRLILNRQ